MKKISIYLFLTFLLFAYKVIAQHPVFTHLTEKDGLPDIEFYSILEDKEGFIWLAADKGLFRYDGKEFKSYTHQNKRGLSVFGLKLDSKGRVWCNNISGQFFYIHNDQLTFFKDLEKEVKGQLANFSFYENSLITSTINGLYQIDLSSLEQVKLFNVKAGFYPFIIKNDRLLNLHDHEIKETTNRVKGKVKYDLSKFRKYNFNKWIITSFKDNNLVYANSTVNLKTKPKLFYEQEDKLIEVNLPETLKINEVIKFHEEPNELWACTRNGVFIYEFKNGKLTYKKTYFQGKAISGVLKDRNNNYWFTTLGNGVYIAPNLFIEKYTIDNKKMNISAMSRIGRDSLIIGSTKGDIALLDNRREELKFLKHIYKEKVYSISDSKEEVYLSLGAGFFMYDKKRKSISKSSFNINAKDLLSIGKNNMLYAAHSSATILNTKEKSFDHLKKTRSYTVYFSSKKEIYVGYVDGVEKYDQNKKPFKVLLNNKPIFAIDIDETDDGTIWISTFKEGLIGVRKGQETINFTKEKGLLSNQTGKIKGDGKLLWIATNKGLQVLDTRTGKFKNLTEKDGINSFNISEIVPFDKTLFFSSNKGLFKLDKEKAFKDRNILNFYFTSILIDDKKVKEKDIYELTANTKKIKFNFHTNGFLAEDNIVYQYKLITTSVEADWNIIDKSVNQITFNNLAAGEYVLKLKATEIDGEKETLEKIVKFNIKLPFYEEWWFLFTIGGVLFVLLWFFFSIRLRRIKRRQQQTIEKERMQKDLVASKLETLQSQMNPHFTFNALNSVQNLVLKGDKQEAYNYLTKFSSLLRENLQMSTKTFVYFEEELSLIKKYLELEKLRFREGFVYEIIGDEVIDDVKIPTMIIQPFIENAIKHGLLHKINGVGKIKIEFFQEKLFKCVITDNGVGIEKSSKINKNMKTKRESFSTKSIRDKLKILKKYYKNDIGFEYEKLKTGTRVVIKIPFTV